MPTHTDAVVIGAGLAGLSAAAHLHQAGLATVVCEAGDEVGGRVRTDRRDGFLLDRGFQVLLPAYPELGRQIDLAALDLRPFLRGLLKTTDTERTWLAAPWHSPQAAAGAVGFLRDHPRDSLALAAVSLRDVLAPGPRISRSGAGTSTLTDLRSRVSEATFTSVLKPFLAGVFLDPSLGTSATLFHLIWRCFLRGGAALPAGGMQMLPRLLAAGLPGDAVRTGTPVTQITDAGVLTGDGEQISARVVIIATDGSTAASLDPAVPPPDWHPVTTFYYRVPASPLGAPVLVIDGDGDLLLNATVLSDVAAGYAPPGTSLVAASVPGRAEPALEPEVRARLARMYDTGTADWELLETYALPRALPVLPAGQSLARPVRLGPGRYVCGDHRDTPSIQGALVSGRRAAQAVLADLARPS
jgi:phytoene dehydrogenase-like protein